MGVNEIRNTPPPAAEVSAQLKFTPALGLKYAAGTALMVACLYYLAKGRKEGNLSYMITGAVLAMLSCAVMAL